MGHLSKKFILFCLVGAISTVLDVGILFVLVQHFNIPILLAATIALLIASMNGFLLNKFFTFKDKSQKLKTQYVSFLIISSVGLLFTLVLMKLFMDLLGINYLIAKLMTIVIVVFWNFTANSVLVFRHKPVPTASNEVPIQP